MKTYVVLVLPMVVSCIVGAVVTYNLKSVGILQLLDCIVCGMMSGIASVVIPTIDWFILEAIRAALSVLGSGLQSVRQDISRLTARLTDAQMRQSNIATQIHELMKELAK